ncbi:DNA adenine methylase [Pseudovibrio sp. Alg231-02]|uniref:DNA adenine methylase n=1 Tax=Pseudovibrio sp. Alg231-02 TaxID=1922223 RepID=UPI00131F2F0D|nr:Dam family site-specific DNA-(adenine-N6)-methyltransferase [Pseudovibrio sp. Alg231-02]
MSETLKLLKWAGSKSNVSEKIKSYLDFSRPYIEPFCGSAAFFFKFEPQVAFLNDVNENLMDCFRHVRDSADDVWKIYDKIEISEERYYEVREEFNELQLGVEKAARFVYLNHYCFNGIYRTNKKGEFNTPFGAKKKVKQKLSLNDFQNISSVLRKATISSDDFEAFIDTIKPERSCIYMDPPYFTNEARVFSEYNSKQFRGDDLARLLKISKKYATNNRIVISYRDCGEFRDLFEPYILGTVPVTRNVGGFVGRRKTETELLAVICEE